MYGRRTLFAQGRHPLDTDRKNAFKEKRPLRTWRRPLTRVALALVIFGAGMYAGVFLHGRDLIPDPALYAMGDGLRAALLGLALLVAAGVIAFSLFSSLRPVRRLREAQAKIARLAATDELTGLANRRSFFVRLKEEIERAERNDANLSLIMFDIDDFGRINEAFGHPVGDAALTEVARLLSANARTSDILARYGGEEFVMLIPAMASDEAARAAEKMRTVVEVNDLVLEGPEVKATLSAGVADVASIEEEDGPLKDRLVRAAHEALRRAKAEGRNRVKVHRKSRGRQLNLV